MDAVKFTSLTRTLFNTEQGRIRYALKALPFAIIPAMVVSMIVGLLFDDLENPGLADDLAVRPVFMSFFVVVIVPLLETLLMWPLIALLALVTRNVWAIAVVSAAVWGLMHSLQVTHWGFNAFIPFVVFSIAFVEWRKKSTGSAILTTWMIHGMQNFIAVSLFLLTPPESESVLPADADIDASNVERVLLNGEPLTTPCANKAYFRIASNCSVDFRRFSSHV